MGENGGSREANEKGGGGRRERRIEREKEKCQYSKKKNQIYEKHFNLFIFSTFKHNPVQIS